MRQKSRENIDLFNMKYAVAIMTTDAALDAGDSSWHDVWNVRWQTSMNVK